jgi:hypothetical protein
MMTVTSQHEDFFNYLKSYVTVLKPGKNVERETAWQQSGARIVWQVAKNSGLQSWPVFYPAAPPTSC